MNSSGMCELCGTRPSLAGSPACALCIESTYLPSPPSLTRAFPIDRALSSEDATVALSELRSQIARALEAWPHGCTFAPHDGPPRPVVGTDECDDNYCQECAGAHDGPWSAALAILRGEK